MKFFAAFVLLIVGVSALPQQQVAARHPVADQIIAQIIDLSERIRERGLDPYILNKEAASIALPVERIFAAAALVEDVMLVGLSDIIINGVTFNPLTSLVQFDLEMPRLYGSVAIVSGALVVFDNQFEGDGSGSITVTDIRLSGTVSVNVGVNGIDANSASVEASFGNIESAISLEIQTPSKRIILSEYINDILNVKVPERLDMFKNEVNDLIAYYLVRFINQP